MDAYGIGNAIKGQTQCYFQMARGTGRTCALIESLQDGDRVIFTTQQEAQRVERLAKELGKEIRTLVVPVKNSSYLFDDGPSEGRTIFDHSWVETYYLDVIDQAAKTLDHLQRETSGYGMAHVETKLATKELQRWRPEEY